MAALWTLGEEIEYANGLQAKVVRVGHGPDSHRAILKLERGYMVASRHDDHEDGDFCDDFEEREEPFVCAADAMAEAGGLWSDGR